MKVLVVTRHCGCLKNYADAISVLAAHGHQVHIAAVADGAPAGRRLVECLAESSAGRVTVGRTPTGPHEPSLGAVTDVRLARDYLRYLEPAYAETPRLQQRAWERTPRGLLWFLELPGARSASVRRILAAALAAVERGFERPTSVIAFLKKQAPDVVILTPLIGLGSSEVEYLLGAQELGLRTVFAVWSWDNLSSKALVRSHPDLVTVWNDVQRDEAIKLHRLPAERIAVTGAQCFDQLFEWSPSLDRAQFCAQVGLPGDRPYILYVCSAPFAGSPLESGFVRRWLEHVRTEPSLRDVGVLVRPHPSRREQWDDVTLEGLGPVVVGGRSPLGTGDQADYYDSMCHAVAVVGLNTSAMIEAGIAGKPVLTVLLPDYADNQEGTLHFPYLLNEQVGLLWSTREWRSHVAQLAEVVAAPVRFAERSRQFVDRFVRPLGRNVSATEQFVEHVEQIANAPRGCEVQLERRRLARTVARVVVGLARTPGVGRLLWDPIKAQEEASRARALREKRREKRRRQRAARLSRLNYRRAQARARRVALRHKAEIRRGKRRRKAQHARHKRQLLVRVITARVRMRLKQMVGFG